MPESYPAEQVIMSDGETSVEEAVSRSVKPKNGNVVVTLPYNSAYGFYYFFLPSTAFALGKTVTITNANFIGDSTNLKNYITPENNTPNELGKIYKINTSGATGLPESLYRNPLFISLSITD